MISKLFIFMFFLISSSNSFSHPGKLSKDGCHYCRKNCEKLGYKSNERHSHNGSKCGNKSINQIKSGSSYNRKEFKHWIDKDKDCQNTRHEILISQSLIPVSFKKTKSGRKCSVVSGKWDDFYFKETLTKASQIDIDHVVPLQNAWISGASTWSAKKKEEFANDPENLVITNKSYNRKKGAQTPLTWSPVDRTYYCKYLNKWIYIKNKYSLKIDPEISNNHKLAKCSK